MVLILAESSCGLALYRVEDGLICKPDKVHEYFTTVGKANEVVTLEAFKKFKDAKNAVRVISKLNKRVAPKMLKKLLDKKLPKGDILGVIDPKLGNALKESLGIKCTSGKAIKEFIKGIQSQIVGLIPGLTEKAYRQMNLDVMIIQAIGLIEEADKELNNYMMRLKEWYGWHFPEMAKLIEGGVNYAKVVQMGNKRGNFKNCDFSEILDELTIEKLLEAAAVSMGSDISEADLSNILALCEQVLKINEHKNQIMEYLRKRMAAIAPNVTAIVGVMVGAKLIARAGSLMKLAKAAASTIQIYGAEKALFRALKKKSDVTPKFGFIFHASVVGKAGQSYKGKISRLLACQTALCARVDALADGEVTDEFGQRGLEHVEKRLIALNSGVAPKRKTPPGGGYNRAPISFKKKRY